MPARRGYEYYEEALLSSKRLLWLMKENDVLDDERSAEALAGYLSVNPRSSEVFDRLSILAGKYEDTKMGDNLKLAVAKATTEPILRVEMLIKLAQRQATDAAIEANFVLGTLTMKPQIAAVGLIEGLQKPQDYFKAVIAARDNPWQRRAATHLTWLTAEPAGRESPGG